MIFRVPTVRFTVKPVRCYSVGNTDLALTFLGSADMLQFGIRSTLGETVVIMGTRLDGYWVMHKSSLGIEEPN